MKRTNSFFMLAAILLTGMVNSAHAQLNAIPPSPHILVYGSAEARVIPDRFKVELYFSVTDMDLDAARGKVEKMVRSNYALLQAHSVADHDISVTSLSVQPTVRWTNNGRTEVFEGHSVNRSLTARFDENDDLSAFLAEVDASAELRISGVSVELSSEKHLRRALRAEAIKSTRDKAAAVAREFDSRIVSLYSVSDTAPKFDYGVVEGSWPEILLWDGDSMELDRIVVSGSRIMRADVTSASPVFLHAGYEYFSDKIYAVFLIEPDVD